MTKKNRPYVLGVILILIVVSLSWSSYDSDFYENILVELHGVIFDTFVIGLFIFLYTKKREREFEIKNLIKEIALYKNLKTPESALKIINNYQVLFDFGVNCDLSSSWFGGIGIVNKDFRQVEMGNCDFFDLNVSYCDFRYAYLRYSEGFISDFNNCDFRGAGLYQTNFIKCSFIECSFNSTILQNITFRNVTFDEVNFVSTHFINVIFEDCTFEKVIFGNTVLTYTNLPEEACISTDKLIVNNNLNYVHKPTSDLHSNRKENLKYDSEIATQLENKFKAKFINRDKKYI